CPLRRWIERGYVHWRAVGCSEETGRQVTMCVVAADRSGRKWQTRVLEFERLEDSPSQFLVEAVARHRLHEQSCDDVTGVRVMKFPRSTGPEQEWLRRRDRNQILGPEDAILKDAFQKARIVCVVNQPAGVIQQLLDGDAFAVSHVQQAR